MYFLYILTNSYNTVLYTGVTYDLLKRIKEHKERVEEKSFSNKYNVNKLIYYEIYNNKNEVYLRERRIKKWKREYKVNIIKRINPSFDDLQAKLLKDLKNQ
jgi:putative endonuclease